MSAVAAGVLLFLVMDPFGNIPLFMVYLRDVPVPRQRRVVLREMAIALFVLVVFLFFGRYLLALLQIGEASLGIAGGIILFLIAVSMVFSGAEQVFRGQYTGEPFIVPLAIPLVAGPSCMATVLLLMAREPHRWLEWLAALVGAWLAGSAILLLAPQCSRALGPRGLMALERLMGLLLTTVAVQMFVDGLRRVWPAAQP